MRTLYQNQFKFWYLYCFTTHDSIITLLKILPPIKLLARVLKRLKKINEILRRLFSDYFVLISAIILIDYKTVIIVTIIFKWFIY